MSILVQLEGVKETLESLHAGGLDLADDINVITDAIDLISNIHSMVDGKEVDSGTTCDLIDALVTYGLDVGEVV